MKFVKSIFFVIAWTLSFLCGIYLYGAIFVDNPSTLDLVMNICGFVLSISWLWFNTIKA